MFGWFERIRRWFAGSAPRRESSISASRAELMSMRRRLERVERLAIAGELAASVAHEIKNPLAPIRGYAQLLYAKLDAVDPEERALFEKGLTVIREEAERIDRRVLDLLAIARRERVGASIDHSCELNQIVLDAVAVAEGEPGAGEIVPRLDPAINRVVGNADELRGALLNLMKNAVEARSGEQAAVEVVTRREGDRAIIEVLDEGEGLDSSSAERAFQAFYTTKEDGTGLGLAIARSAIDAAGGVISLGPRSDRKGAIARIELDLAKAGT